MKYTEEERLDIGRRVYTHKLTEAEACAEYDLGTTSVERYVQKYKVSQGIYVNSKKYGGNGKVVSYRKSAKGNQISPEDLELYQSMTKDQLIDELIRAKAGELRAKKGYEVKGDGANKEFISLRTRNMK